MPYQAGDVLLADLDPVAGHEQGGGRRPVLVLSGPSYNTLRNEQLIVAAITSRQRHLPFHSVQRIVSQLGRARSQTVADVRSRVVSFLRDW